jgi:catechol 2,3-dioxygenase-like lactoylglutathione lyase family enzyme
MKQLYITTLCLIAMTGAVIAQETQVISTGQGYNNQDYVHITDGTNQQVANAAWDIAFSVADGEAGVFINESVGSNPSDLPIQAFATFSDDFSFMPEESFFIDYPIWNRETSWSHGALNEYREAGDPNDYGWGMYNQGTGEIDGIYVFVIELRDGTYLKLQIQSLISGVYTFRYANLDGSNESTKTISKADFAGDVLAYFSFGTGETVEVEPNDGFDLLFCRYVALLDAGGDTVPYVVTGILSAPGIEVAQADGIDPETVEFEPYRDSLSNHPEIIGHDWKSFNLGAFQWEITPNLAYFVKTRDEHIWKWVPLEFSGSGSGNATFGKTDLGILSAVHDPSSPLAEFSVYPNPSFGEFHVAYSLKNPTAGEITLQLFDTHGRFIEKRTTNANEGLNVYTMHKEDLLPGTYILRMVVGGQVHNDLVQVVR